MLWHVRTVLVSPRTSENVAASARACDAFECEDLRLVRPRCRYRDEGRLVKVSRDARAMAMVQVHEDLQEALQGARYAVAFTRRAGGMRPSLLRADARGPLPWRTSAHDAPSTVALVFGREESGLTDEEIMACTHGCYLPTGRTQGSLNLSHAVCLALSDEFRHATTAMDVAKPFGRERTHRNAELVEKEAWLNRVRRAMATSECLPHERRRRIRHLERLLKRSDVDVQELQALHGILTSLLGSAVSEAWNGTEQHR